MLNARRAVVPFTGRAAELADLHDWRDAESRLAVRWLYGPGGQGKTRLANQLAATSMSVGWKVIVAFHGPDADPVAAGSQDLSLTGAAGLLVIVDYADRWLLRNLTWLLKNSLLHHDAVRTRVLLIGRTADTWPAICAILDNFLAITSSQSLAELTQIRDRTLMFEAARDRFAEIYRQPDALGPGQLELLAQPEFGLTLAIQMAALVLTDTQVAGQHMPSDLAGLTIYLLNREELSWARRYGDGASAADGGGHAYLTQPNTMNHAVFVAALTGAVKAEAGLAVLSGLGFADPRQTLRDHAACYPPAEPGVSVLEPIYPDRLAEDFIALALPGHGVEHPSKQWAPTTLAALLARPDDKLAPAYVARAVTFVASAAQRWHHLGQGYLYPLLRQDPQLAIDAGNAALVALSALPDLDIQVMESIDALLPERHVELDPGIAILTG